MSKKDELILKALKITKLIEKNKISKKSKITVFKTNSGLSFMLKEKVSGTTFVKTVNKNSDKIEQLKNSSNNKLLI